MDGTQGFGTISSNESTDRHEGKEGMNQGKRSEFFLRTNAIKDTASRRKLCSPPPVRVSVECIQVMRPPWWKDSFDIHTGTASTLATTRLPLSSSSLRMAWFELHTTVSSRLPNIFTNPHPFQQRNVKPSHSFSSDSRRAYVLCYRTATQRAAPGVQQLSSK